MSLIYPFKLIEKKYGFDINFKRCDVIKEFIHHDCGVINEFEGDLKEYVNLYGYEAVRMFMLLHPIHKKCILNNEEVFGCWKVMNRVWNILNEDLQDCILDFSVQIEGAKKALENNKIHTYFAFFMKTLKLLKHSSMNIDCKQNFLNCFGKIFPLMLHELYQK